MDGFLAIWSDLAPEDETDWAHWMTREHSGERLGVDGFRGCRIFRALETGVNRYFILYDLESPGAVSGPSYLARLNAPTPWSQRIMPRLRNFARGGGRVAAAAGIGQGGILAIVPLSNVSDLDPDAICKEAVTHDRVAAARVLLTDPDQTSIETREKAMRAGDRSFQGLLLVEGLDAASIRDAVARLRARTPRLGANPESELALYTTCFSLTRPAAA